MTNLMTQRLNSMSGNMKCRVKTTQKDFCSKQLQKHQAMPAFNFIFNIFVLQVLHKLVLCKSESEVRDTCVQITCVITGKLLSKLKLTITGLQTPHTTETNNVSSHDSLFR